jgi:PAS domain S-box-containing protein
LCYKLFFFENIYKPIALTVLDNLFVRSINSSLFLAFYVLSVFLDITYNIWLQITTKIFTMSKAIYESVLMQAPTGFVFFSFYNETESGVLEYIVQDANQAFLKLLGISSVQNASEIDRLFYSEVNPGYCLYRFLDEVVESKQDAEYEFFYDELDIWISAHAFLVNSVNIVVFFTDVTEKIKAQEDIRINELKFRSFLDSISNISVKSWLPTGEVVFWNSASEKLYGYNKEEAVGKNILDLIVPGYLKNQVRNTFNNIIETGVIRPAEEIYLKHKNGSRIPVYSNQVVVTLSEKYKELFSVDVDLSELKDAEDLLRKLSMAIEQSPASTIITNIHGVIEYVNPKFCEITGYLPNEVVGKNPRVLNSGQTPGSTFTQLWQTINMGNEWRGEFINRKKNGELFYESAVISPIVDENGIITHFVAVKEDVTDRIQAQKSIVQQSNNLAALLDISQDFLATLDIENLLKLIVRKGTELINVETGSLFTVNQSAIELQAAWPLIAKETHQVLYSGTKADSPMLSRCIDTKAPYLIEDVSQIYLSKLEELFITERKVVAILLLPLFVKEDVFGILALGIKKATRKFSKLDIELCQTMASQASLAIENARLFKQSRRFAEHLMEKNREQVSLNEDLIIQKERAEESEKKLIASEQRLKIKLNSILSPEFGIEDLPLTDIMELKDLQEIQNAFSSATGVASVIIDKNGIAITQPSNYSSLCQIIWNNEAGRKRCVESKKRMGVLAVEKSSFIIEPCSCCGFLDAAAPIYVGDKLVAYWMIGQKSQSANTKDKIKTFAKEIGEDVDFMLKELAKLDNMPSEQFKDIAELLWIVARDLSTMAYKNLMLAKRVEEQKDYEAELINSKERAEESDRLKTAFLQNMSHEIRTPMNGILGFSELLKIEGLTSEKRMAYTGYIVDSTKQLLAIVDDIMDISRLEAGDVALRNEEVCLKTLALELFDTYSLQVSEKIDFKFLNANSSCNCVVIADSYRLRQVMAKLITNAIKFTHHGHIHFGFERINEKISFFVEDTGIGVTPDKLNLIFKPFYQADMDASREFGGNGLGLTIASRIVEKMGSEIKVKSQPGLGSRFSFEFNCSAQSEIKQNVTRVISYIEKDIFTVLVAEDDDVNFLFINDALLDSAYGHKFEIIRARNGIEAVDMFKENGFIDLVLMDLKMPGMDGLEATKLIKKEAPDVPVIAQTAFSLTQEQTKTKEAGCDAYLSKPINLNHLIQVVYQYLQLPFENLHQ